jgi:hypothetical protein
MTRGFFDHEGIMPQPGGLGRAQGYRRTGVSRTRGISRVVRPWYSS